MGVLQPLREVQRLESHGRLGANLLCRVQDNGVRDRAGGRSAAERAVLEIRVGAGVMVMPRRHWHVRRHVQRH